MSAADWHFTNTTRYICHECGHGLEETNGRLLWCANCLKRRRVPTHPALIVKRPA